MSTNVQLFLVIVEMLMMLCEQVPVGNNGTLE